MSLVINAMEKTYIMDKVTVKDEYGGYTTTYKEGADILVAYSFDSSTQARIAEQEGVKNRYKLTTKRNINLQFHQILKRDRDSKIFRVTSDGDDNYTPNTAGIDIRQVEAEEWELPINE